ncbi:DnaD domain protein [Staphylococcus sp. SQ8-PEA]|uniref:DnaD domain protein n=1 Tax=Staphylococcus marylandisciuri TaxID=2981529 RepID=A0ABT2QQ50_9STAP|nr:DnaD domain protein [Staphylococcus marylandisciuri]MCU5746087.1 DnaD domain protein [Staphylococcus marylandisciuri]
MTMNVDDYGLRPKDHFDIVRHFQLHHSHLEIINRLFTPLIGSSATGLYLYLDQFADTRDEQLVHTHYTIMNELKINLLEFRNNMDVLEGIGLVKTYVKHRQDASHFLYELVQPPSAKQFFDDPMLSVFLHSEIGNQRYHQLKRFFEFSKQVDLSDFQEITCKYTDVFKIPETFSKNEDNRVHQDDAYKGLDLSEVKFDFELLYDLLQSHFISTKIVDSNAKKLIIQLATLYGLTPEAMKSIILKSITSAQELSQEELRKQARTYYFMEHGKTFPNLQVRSNYEQPSLNTNGKPEEAEKEALPGTEGWFELLEKTSPIDMLASWSESEPTTQQKKIVEELIEREKLSFGVINVLLQYVMLKEDMKLPKNYIMEIASNWKKKGFNNSKEAYTHVVKQASNKKEKTNQKRYYKPNYYSRELTPEWLKKRKKNNNEERKNNSDESSKIDESLQQDREAFLKYLNQTWNGGDDG